ncbi:glycogen debranching N-terminal domain-containing protein [Deinococcus multiflagellatus]|uniref:Glycogen debranching N-terminal domain-containing protein n=1 Tax=Deinococcus multiflagellatus TaxID=1656887 RepID=A0ABW1ZN84_9DEIO|nr:glycogen debranching N-terminal domain-containing protein [Deinococcus multiflagellatus]MBZ9714084.1 amylo-alpha-1,6-glucosidase [Deinococcus multiflagellatus]
MLNTRTVLKDNDLYLVGDAQYVVAQGESGLYRRDTRVLSRYEWRLDGQPPQPLLQQERAPFWLHEQAANANVGYTMKVGLRRDLTLSATELRDTLQVTRYRGQGPHELKLYLGADYLDMFEVRGWPGGLGTRAVKAQATAQGVTFAYAAGDGLRSRTVVQASLPATWDGEALVWTLPDAHTQLQVSVFPLQDDETPTPGDPAALLAEYRALTERLRAQVRLPDPADQQVLERSVADLRSLSFQTDHGAFPAAGLPWFVAPFGRDSMLMALMVHRHLPELARTVARYLAAHQGVRHDPVTLEQPGKILHELRVGELTRLGHTPHRPYYATADATPLFVWLVGELAQADPALAHDLRPHWEAALSWCLHDGDPDGDGFLEYTPDPNGITNAVWKDSGDSTFTEDGVDVSGHVAVIEVQGYAYAAYRAAASMYRQLGEPGAAEAWDARALALQAAFQRAFWWPERGTYVHGLNGDKQPLRVLVSNAAHTLCTGIIAPPYAAQVAASALGPELWSGWGIRTLGTGERRYNPVSYHNGSVWPHDTALAALGMARCGLHAQAQQVARALFDAARAAPDHRLSELFAGFPREAHTPPVPYPAACHPQGWDAAIPLALWPLLAGSADAVPQPPEAVASP